MSVHTNDNAQLSPDFLSKREAIMSKLVEQLSDTEQPSIEKILSLLDTLGLDDSTRTEIRQRILREATETAAEIADAVNTTPTSPKRLSVGLLSSVVSPDNEYYLFAVTAAIVLIVFGKNEIVFVCYCAASS